MAVPGGPGLLLISFSLLYGLRLDATRYSKNLRSAPQAKDAWARVLARGQEDPSQLLDVREVNYSTLRLAKVRLHAFQCLLWRLFFPLSTDRCHWINHFLRWIATVARSGDARLKLWFAHTRYRISDFGIRWWIIVGIEVHGYYHVFFHWKQIDLVYELDFVCFAII